MKYKLYTHKDIDSNEARKMSTSSKYQHKRDTILSINTVANDKLTGKVTTSNWLAPFIYSFRY